MWRNPETSLIVYQETPKSVIGVHNNSHDFVNPRWHLADLENVFKDSFKTMVALSYWLKIVSLYLSKEFRMLGVF